MSKKTPLQSIFTSTVLIRVLALMSTLGFTSILSFQVTQSAYGTIVTVMTLALFASSIGEFGQRELTAREISKFQAASDNEASSNFAANSTALALWTGSAAGLVTSVVLHANKVPLSICIIGGTITVILSLNAVWSGVGRAYGQFFWALAPREVFWRLLIIVTIAALLISGIQPNALLSSAIVLATIFACTAAQAAMLRKIVPITSKLFPIIKKSYILSSTNICLTNVSGIAIASLDIVILSFIAGSVATAEYFPANRIAVIAIYLHVTFNIALLPHLSALFATENASEVARTAKLMSRISFGASLLITLAIALSEPIFKVFFSSATTTTWLACVILCAGNTASIAFGYGNTILLASGKEQLLRSISIWSIIGSAGMMLAGGIAGGTIGIAITAATATIIRQFLVMLITDRTFGFRSSMI